MGPLRVATTVGQMDPSLADAMAAAWVVWMDVVKATPMVALWVCGWVAWLADETASLRVVLTVAYWVEMTADVSVDSTAVNRAVGSAALLVASMERWKVAETAATRALM